MKIEKITESEALFFRDMCIGGYEVGGCEEGTFERAYSPVIQTFFRHHLCGISSRDIPRFVELLREIADKLEEKTK